jgi:hypothetical protein
MNTYIRRKRRNTINYRQIYENHFGPIPIDNEGRSYEIHHIDGNPNNNSIDNLKAVSLQDHYDIHYSQGDYGACWIIGKKLALTSEQISDIARRNALIRVNAGTHNFQGYDNSSKRAKRLVAEGKHNFLGGEIQRKHNNRRVADGTHHLLSGEIQRQANNERLLNGTHQNLTRHCCPHCNQEGTGPIMRRWHYDNCKLRQDTTV